MIIFDLDGTLANCEHRRHLVDSSIPDPIRPYKLELKWSPDWKAFYEACDKDEPIYPTLELIDKLLSIDMDIQIWSGRCESVRKKTDIWLKKYIDYFPMILDVKMRPIGDNMPDDQLKERWLDEALAEGKKIDFVFDDRPKVVRMWRRRGIFVFDCNQDGKEF